ncbi:MAG: hypothetical protein A3B38_01945 [Candidatus Levybacteria bacterium RIFCSPLOWO2_01_FULL_36_13]|nr:MAG: hypothetical protein A2684_03180 [Candidatus Levybacteria bacterium RIFCSPHIGHO2_01_FULL_36_15b]OGH35624.1 MAG: hypothetical protein A3B38_01945 [Candidatus Levybacteria bacterium RIFCSPLOWO2_01_FULL_36_13]
MKVALVYDRVNKWGGAERVLLSLNKIFPKADLFTSVYNKEKAPWAKKFNIKTSFLQKIPGASSRHEFLATLMPIAFEGFNFENYDLVISVTSESAKGIITKPKTLHICYCLTPTRYLWSGYNVYFKGRLFKLFSKPVVSYLRLWDKIASQRPDYYIAISNEVKKRIKNYYGQNSSVIFPPLSISDVKPKLPAEQNYFLIISRLVAYKRIDMAISVFNKLKLPLKIIGTGWEEGKLKRKAGSNIEFIKNLSEEELYGYYLNCRAFIFPTTEDFGLAMVEAQYFGKPVIAYKAGGALDIVKEGKTGEFFGSEPELENVLENFKANRYNREACIENSLRFSHKEFKKNLLDFIERNKV